MFYNINFIVIWNLWALWTLRSMMTSLTAVLILCSMFALKAKGKILGLRYLFILNIRNV